MKNLISLLTYVLELPKDLLIQTRLFRIELYANFLNQKLSEPYEVNGVLAHPINRFVPCDLDGNILKSPLASDFSGKTLNWVQDFREAEEQYKKSEDRMLFKGFVYNNGWFYLNELQISGLYFKAAKIEHLTKNNIELTTTAQKLIGVSPN